MHVLTQASTHPTPSFDPLLPELLFSPAKMMYQVPPGLPLLVVARGHMDELTSGVTRPHLVAAQIKILIAQVAHKISTKNFLFTVF